MDVIDTFFNLRVLGETLPLVLSGLWVTVLLGAASILLGNAGGLALAVGRVYGRPWLRLVAVAYIDVFRAIPLLVLLIVIYYALPFVGIRLSPFAAATSAISLVAAAYSAEIFRAGIEAIPSGQIDASRALGLHWWLTFRLVVLPQAVRIIVPPLTGNAINVIKDTALASVVALPDLLKQATQAQALAANPSPLIGAALIYLVILLPLVRAVAHLERRYAAARAEPPKDRPMPLDLEFVRAQFPGLASPWVYMDNAGGSHVLAGVADRVRDFLLTTPVQHGASYEPSREAAARVAAATARIAAMIGAVRPEEVVIGGSTTLLLQQLARGMASSFSPGDEIVVTDVDHEANIGPWRALESQGVVLREWQVDPLSLELDLGSLDRLLGPRTRLVCVTHCSNVLGTVMPISEVARRAHAAGAELCVDGVALAPHRSIDLQALGCDWYVYSFYKTFGPHQAVLWGRYQRLLELSSLNHFFIGRDRVPYKLQPGNVNYELAWGCAGIPDYLDQLTDHHGADAFELIAAQEEALAARLLEWLTARNDVRVIGRCSADRQERVATVSFVVEERRSDDIVASVDRAQVGIRHGDFYARRLIERLGLADIGGVVRVSMVHYNTLGEVDRLIEALDQALLE